MPRGRGHPVVVDTRWTAALVLALSACASSDAPVLRSTSPIASLSAVPNPVTPHTSHEPTFLGDPRGTHRAPELNLPYLSCARARGFDPETAEVLVDKAEVPWWVIVASDVPAEVHGPCMVSIGGKDRQATAWGRDRLHASATHTAPYLDFAYKDCLREKGFDSGGLVQVSVDAFERPDGVKVGYEVPANVHGPCMVRIGGVDRGTSSYGTPR